MSTRGKSPLKKLASKPLLVPQSTKEAKSQRVDRQMSLPASFVAKGKRIATMQQHLDVTKPTLAFDELTEEQWRLLAAKRVRAQDSFELVVPGYKKLSRTKAAREITQGTPLGELLMQIEIRQIRAEAAALVSKTANRAKREPNGSAG